MKTTSILILVISVCILALAVLFYTNQMPKDRGVPLGPTPDTFPARPQQPSPESDESPTEYPIDQSKFIGVLREVDMLQDQAQRMQLQLPAYVVTTEAFTLASRPTARHLYLKQTQVPADTSMEELAGKCVEVAGTLDPLSMEQDGMYNGEALLGGFILVTPTISSVDMQNCDSVISKATRPVEYETLELEGVVSRINRPAADIAYDYVITTTVPIPGASDMSGTGRPINSLVVMPSDFETYRSVEESLGEDVKVRGYLQWGYAESQFFTVEELDLQ